MNRRSPSQRALLRFLRENPAVSINILAAELYLDRSTVIIGLRQLEQQGCIVRYPGFGPKPNKYIVME